MNLPETFIPPQSIDIEREIIKRKGLKEFIKRAWNILEPSDPLIWNWHIDALCDHTEALFTGKIQHLLINVPPGTMKSLVCSVAAPAWMWTVDPSKRMLFASYGERLSLRDSMKTRRVINSNWYQERWGDDFEFMVDQDTKSNFQTNKTGFRYATSVGGTVTGERGHLVCCDDIMNVKKADSKAHQLEVHNFFWEVLPSRVNDLRTGLFLVIMQRCHTEDPSGEILARQTGELAGKKWVHLNLPMEYRRPKILVNGFGFQDPRTVEDEVLHPERFPPSVINELKKDLGSYAYAGQYQQEPVPREGGLIKEKWLRNRFKCEMTYDELMRRNPLMVMQSADCSSKPKQHNDPTVWGTLAVFADRAEVWNVTKKRVEFPERQQTFKDLGNAWRPNGILIEDKDSGQSHIQQLEADPAYKIPIIKIIPDLDKFTRMAGESPFIEAGKLWLPEDADWVGDFVTELCTFNLGAAHDDQVDMLSQFLNWLRRFGYVDTDIAADGVDQTSPHSINGFDVNLPY